MVKLDSHRSPSWEDLNPTERQIRELKALIEARNAENRRRFEEEDAARELEFLQAVHQVVNEFGGWYDSEEEELDPIEDEGSEDEDPEEELNYDGVVLGEVDPSGKGETKNSKSCSDSDEASFPPK